MYNKNPTLFLFWMLTLFLWGTIIFLIGFFPESQTKFHLNDDNEQIEPFRYNLQGHILTPPPKRHSQIVLMVIDALRDDFLSSASMPYTYQTACNALTLHADIPTVTMPRLKSMTTGVLSNFIDILFNLGNTQALNDSIVHGVKQRGDTLAFAGDHTWIKLFPNEFTRAMANNDSFFVQDFFDGDRTVTKTLKTELQRNDWSFLVLHYLGLDHIGHVEGTSSAKIPGKLLEMDQSVEMIMNDTNSNNRLLLLTGDHGMRNGGGHGGGTPEESTVPLYVFHKNCHKKVVNRKQYNQIDLAPTLAILFSIEIPKKSIGCLIPELLSDLTLEEQLYAYHYNAAHLMQQANSKFGSSAMSQSDYSKWLKSANEAHIHFLTSQHTSTFMFEKAKHDYIRMSRTVSEMLAESLITFDYAQIALGLSLTVAIAVFTLIVVLFSTVRSQTSHNNRQLLFAFITAVILMLIAYYMDFMKITSVLSILTTLPTLVACIYIWFKILSILLQLLLPLSKRRGMHLSLTLPLPYLAGFIFHTCSLGSSSFIEEEHQSWYYLGPTMLIITLALALHKKIQREMLAAKEESIGRKIALEFSKMCVPFFMLAFITVLRRLNQTGDKWAHLPDIENYLNKAEHRTSLTLFFIFGLYNLVLRIRPWLTNVQLIAATLAVCFVYIFRGVTGVVHMFPAIHLKNLVLFSFWICIIVVAAVPYWRLFNKSRTFGYEPKANLVQLLQTNLGCSLLIAALLHKPHNVVLLPALIFTLHVSYKLCDTYLLYCGASSSKSYALIQKTVLTIFIANMFYFYQGNSNAISNVDLNPGYIGQSTYQPVFVFIFVTLNTYCSPINAFLCLVIHMFEKQTESLPQRQEKEQFSNFFLIQINEHDMHLVVSLYTAFTILPVAFYLCLLVAMRHHLFIYSVFAPKAFYECFSVLVFYINFIFMTFYLKLFKCAV